MSDISSPSVSVRTSLLENRAKLAHAIAALERRKQTLKKSVENARRYLKESVLVVKFFF